MALHTMNFENGNNKKGLSSVLKGFVNKIAEIFQPEEVEVTFDGEGVKSTYTYTKISHKQVA